MSLIFMKLVFENDEIFSPFYWGLQWCYFLTQFEWSSLTINLFRPISKYQLFLLENSSLRKIFPNIVSMGMRVPSSGLTEGCAWPEELPRKGCLALCRWKPLQFQPAFPLVSLESQIYSPHPFYREKGKFFKRGFLITNGFPTILEKNLCFLLNN